LVHKRRARGGERKSLLKLAIPGREVGRWLARALARESARKDRISYWFAGAELQKEGHMVSATTPTPLLGGVKKKKKTFAGRGEFFIVGKCTSAS